MLLSHQSRVRRFVLTRCCCICQATGLTAANVEAAAATGVAGSVAWAPLDWARADEWLAARAAAVNDDDKAPFDFILGADLVYHQQHDFGPVTALAALLDALLSAAPAARVVFGYQERDAAARLAFWAALAAAPARG